MIFLILSYTMDPVSAPEPLISPSALSTYQSQGKLFNLFITPWYRWDTVHYLDIAENGYMADRNTTVWPPMYPLLIKLFTFITNSYLLSGIIVSNLAFFCALYLLYLLTSTQYSEEVARRSLIYLIIFPTAFFFVAPYSESLFLALSVGFFLAVRKQKWWMAGLLGICAVLTRLQGVFLVVPLIWTLLQSLTSRRQTSKKLNGKLLIPISVISATFFLYFLSVHFILGREWPWMTLQSNWSQKIGFPWEGLIGNIKILVGISPLCSNSYIATFFDALVFLGSIILLIITRTQLNREHLIYSIILLLLFSVKLDQSGFLVSTSRYILSIFPLFFSLAIIFKKVGRIVFTTLSLFSQMLLLCVFYLWGWVA